MLTGPGNVELQRVALFRTIRDAIVGKNLLPSRSIHADVRPLDAAGCVFNIEDHSHTIPVNLRLAASAHRGRRVVDIHRLANSFAAERQRRWVIRSIGRYHAKHVTTVGETCAVNRKESFADVVLP